MGYLYANFGLPRPLCSRLRPDVCDRRQTDRRQTDVRQKRRLMPRLLGAGIIILMTVELIISVFICIIVVVLQPGIIKKQLINRLISVLCYHQGHDLPSVFGVATPPKSTMTTVYSLNSTMPPTSISLIALVSMDVCHIMPTLLITTYSTIWFSVPVQTNMCFNVI